jgi:glycosyltransferase involved in cell wall biosynthesis
MRVFLISNMYPSEKDPLFGVFIKNFRSELELQGVRFNRTALIRGKSGSVLKKLLVYAKHYSRILYHFFSYRYDLIYLHYLSHHLPVLLPMVFLGRRPLVVNVHGSDVIGLRRHPFVNFLAKIVLRRIRLLVVPTTYFRDFVLDHYPFMNSKAIVVSPSGGVDGSRFYPLDDARGKDGLSLGFVSRFIEEKGWKTFLDALAILKNKGVLFHAVIAGKGPDESAILKYITALGLKEDVVFLGLVKQEELASVYSSLDLYIFPTYREAESLGLTGLEAMSCGVPVIACNLAGPKTYIKNGLNGYLFPPKDAAALSNCILDFTAQSDVKKGELKENALQTAATFEKTAVARNLIGILESL